MLQNPQIFVADNSNGLPRQSQPEHWIFLAAVSLTFLIVGGSAFGVHQFGAVAAD